MKKFALIIAGAVATYAIVVTAINFFFDDNEYDDYDIDGEIQAEAEAAAGADAATC